MHAEDRPMYITNIVCSQRRLQESSWRGHQWQRSGRESAEGPQHKSRADVVEKETRSFHGGGEMLVESTHYEFLLTQCKAQHTQRSHLLLRLL